MLTFRLLGGIGLTDPTGKELDALLRQPKHVALLAYLSLPQPGTWHRRDSVLGTFWPETDQSHARAALRSALYTLRNHLPDRVIRSRGDDDLSIDPSLLRTDVSALSDDFIAGRSAQVLANYKGELLSGLFIGDAPAFEKWLDTERSRVKGIVRKAGAQLSQQLELRGDLAGAIDAARQAYELEPDDESAARRWISLLDRAGDRSQAFAVYERFRNHMSDAFGVRPSAETVALLDAIRTRREMSGTVDISQHPTQSPASQTALVATKRSHRLWMFVAIPLVLAVAGFILLKPARPSPIASAPRSLVVLPMENQTGDPQLDYIAAGIAEGVARRLDGFGGMRVRSGARSNWSERVRRDTKRIGRELGSTMLLRTTLKKAHDSLEVTSVIVDAETSELRDIGTRSFLTNGIRDVESRVSADVAGALFRKPLPDDPRDAGRSIDPESYKLTLRAWNTMLASPSVRDDDKPPREYTAREDFSKAIAIDPLNARAWSGLSSVWASLTGGAQITFEEGFARTSAAALHALAIDSLQGTAWANLGGVRALKYDNLSMGLELIHKGERAEPSNPEIFLIESTLLRMAHQYDRSRDAVRVARSLDPLSLVYWNHEAQIEFCADRPDQALTIFDKERRVNPQNVLAVNGVVRSLALLGRFDEAIALWRGSAERRGESSLAKELGSAKGAKDYWALRHREGQKRLVKLMQNKEDATPFLMIMAQFAAGNPDAAYQAIDDAPASEKPTLYRLSCYQAADEYKHEPRFLERTRRIGALKDH